MHDPSTEALVRSLGGVVADFRREIARDIETARLQAQAIVAEARAGVAEAEARRDAAVLELRRAVEDRLALVKDGAPGADGKDGLDGEPGRDGLDGAPGRDGVDGKDGAPGEKGDPGEAGPAGRDGTDGAPGRDGADGIDGAAGADGAPGRDGNDGADGKSVTPRGTFDAEADYAELDVVMMGGSSFIATKDAPGPCPGAGWQLLASRGSRGDRGERGAPGRDGLQGKEGPRGPAGESIAAVYVDGSELVITMDSGRELKAALPRVTR